MNLGRNALIAMSAVVLMAPAAGTELCNDAPSFSAASQVAGLNVRLHVMEQCTTKKPVAYLTAVTRNVSERFDCNSLTGCSVELLIDGKPFRTQAVPQGDRVLKVLDVEVVLPALRSAKTLEVEVPVYYGLSKQQKSRYSLSPLSAL